MTTPAKPQTQLPDRSNPKDLAEALRPYTDEERAALIALLRSWREVDEEDAHEQEETG